MGFIAAEQIEQITYDFAPYGPKGTVPEPSTKAVEQFRQGLFATVSGLGISPEDLSSGKVGFEQVGALMDKAGEVEQGLLDAVADLTGIAHSVLNALPYRVQAAFAGYIVGLFINPEA